MITDENVWACHGYRLCAAFASAGLRKPLVRILPPGECSKTRESKAAIEDWMLAEWRVATSVWTSARGSLHCAITKPIIRLLCTCLQLFASSHFMRSCLRDTLVVAFGGGVVGDLAGFVAATYMRGVPVVQVPTTLLAMVDSSIGGKTGLDVPAGKNLVGSFYQPVRVVADMSMLATLPLRELSNGIAEVIKAGAIADASLFALLEREADAVLGEDVRTEHPLPDSTAVITDNSQAPRRLQRRLNLTLLRDIVRASIAVKVRVVCADEREGGERATLNFGHTIGHAIEAEESESSGMLHGEAVAIGMVKEAEVARALHTCDGALVGRIKRLLKDYRLPTVLPAHLAEPAGVDQLVRRMAVDKKNSGGAHGGVKIKCVLLQRIGAVAAPPFAHAVSEALLRRVLSTAVFVAPPTATFEVPNAPIVVHVPGSKSVSNRALLLAGISQGTTRLRGLLSSDDTAVMIGALEVLGASVAWEDEEIGDGRRAPVAVVTGMGGIFVAPSRGTRIYIGNAGTASRFLASVLCLLQRASNNDADQTSGDIPMVVLEGNARMAVRPIAPLVDALAEQGADIRYSDAHPGCPPLAFHTGLSPHRDSEWSNERTDQPTSAKGVSRMWRRRLVHLTARLSSQYVSSVLLAAPYFPPVTLDAAHACAASREADTAAAAAFGADVPYTELVLAEETPTSLPYIRMTLTVMASFGVNAVTLAANRYLVPATGYTAPRCGKYDVEADASSASYAAALAPILRRRVVLAGVGSASTQGDAAFPMLLQRMGCIVEQSASSTTIDPPPNGGSGLVAIAGNVDMADTTDTFMTLAAVAAVAEGVTRIVGIANQRVKECDRIAATVGELRKAGIAADELPDGVVITGTGLLGSSSAAARIFAAPHGARIHCHDDHRIAMSFAVLAACIPGGLTIDDAACVDKTYPAFWDDAETLFGLRVRADAAPSTDFSPPPAVGTSLWCAKPLILIGMRGAGKSSLGRRAAAALSLTPWPHAFIDLDVELEQTERATCAAIVARDGWAAFRAAELAVLRAALNRNTGSIRSVIATGGGIVETAEARALLAAHVSAGGVIVEVRRSIEDIEIDIGSTGASDAGRPAYAAASSLTDVYLRRQTHYAALATHVFVIPRSYRNWDVIGDDFAAFAERVSRLTLSSVGNAVVNTVGNLSEGQRSIAQGAAIAIRSTADAVAAAETDTNASGSSFVCIAVADLRLLARAEVRDSDDTWLGASDAMLATLVGVIGDVTRGADAVEIRADMFRRYDDDFVLYQITLLRLVLRSCNDLPIVFTVRSAAEGGSFAGSIDEYVALMLLGCRAGVDILDVELGPRAPYRLATKSILSTCRMRSIAVIGSSHWQFSAPSNTALRMAAKSCWAQGEVDIVKLVARVNSSFEASQFQAAAHDAVRELSTAHVVPLIAIAMGPQGTLSRITNQLLTPTTSDALPTAAAPGQLTLAAIRTCRVAAALRRVRRYVLVGAPISSSLSPTLHEAAFRESYLPDHYGLHETMQADTAAAILRAVDGGNVTIPLKSDMLPWLDSITNTANCIGAINTVVTVKGLLHGDNTDWLGIYLPLRKALQSRSFDTPRAKHEKRVLIVGAGGTAAAAAFAAHALGATPTFTNRTQERAEALARRFGGTTTPFDAPNVPPEQLLAVIVTLPASARWAPSAAILQAQGAVLLDVAYKPAETIAVASARRAGWITVSGEAMLVAQGLVANALWSGRGATAELLRVTGLSRTTRASNLALDAIQLNV